VAHRTEPWTRLGHWQMDWSHRCEKCHKGWLQIFHHCPTCNVESHKSFWTPKTSTRSQGRGVRFLSRVDSRFLIHGGELLPMKGTRDLPTQIINAVSELTTKYKTTISPTTNPHPNTVCCCCCCCCFRSCCLCCKRLLNLMSSSIPPPPDPIPVEAS
jgi:hypothetical protein